jgi:hypothetical protein
MFNIQPHLASLPTGPNPRKITDKYMFLDTKRVVNDMRDLGYEPTGFRRAKGRTVDAAYGLHEVEFMQPSQMGITKHEAPRVLFMNSYDGTRKARFAAGLFRFACLNGMILGDLFANLTFLHMGDYEEELMANMKAVAEDMPKVFDKIDGYRNKVLDDQIYLEMAEQALAIRYPDENERLVIEPATLIMPRRQEDTAVDLYTTFNVLQENIIRGGVPGLNGKGQAKLSQPVKNIERSNSINRELWNLMDRTADLVNA